MILLKKINLVYKYIPFKVCYFLKLFYTNLPQAKGMVHFILLLLANTYNTVIITSTPSANIRQKTAKYTYCSMTATAVQVACRRLKANTYNTVIITSTPSANIRQKTAKYTYCSMIATAVQVACRRFKGHDSKPQVEIPNNVVCGTSKASDKPAHTRSLIRAFTSCMNIL